MPIGWLGPKDLNSLRPRALFRLVFSFPRDLLSQTNAPVVGELGGGDETDTPFIPVKYDTLKRTEIWMLREREKSPTYIHSQGNHRIERDTAGPCDPFTIRFSNHDRLTSFRERNTINKPVEMEENNKSGPIPNNPPVKTGTTNRDDIHSTVSTTTTATMSAHSLGRLITISQRYHERLRNNRKHLQLSCWPAPAPIHPLKFSTTSLTKKKSWLHVKAMVAPWHKLDQSMLYITIIYHHTQYNLWPPSSFLSTKFILLSALAMARKTCITNWAKTTGRMMRLPSKHLRWRDVLQSSPARTSTKVCLPFPQSTFRRFGIHLLSSLLQVLSLYPGDNELWRIFILRRNKY